MYNFDELFRANVRGIVVDAGHGGTDPGAIGSGLLEKDLNLKAAKYMYQRFKDLGIPVSITRDDDTTLSRNERVNKMVNTFGNTSDVLVLSNHINAGGGEGAEIVYPLRDNGVLAQNILDEIGKQGQIKRKAYQRRLPENPSQDYYYIQRLTPNTKSYLIEYGFIDNKNDAKKLENNLLDYVEGVVKAVAEYANVPYTSPIETTNVYTVKKGDSLYSIANKYNTTVDAIKKINNLTSNFLQVGQILTIPNANVVIPPEGTTYMVKKGDNLYQIAKVYNTTPEAIKSLNNLTGDTLQIGQILQIPQESATDEEAIYIVQRGDSLYKIASMFSTTVDEIRRLNNLTTDMLQIGQSLKIPTTNQTTENVYIVQRGDSLYKIAKMYNTTPEKLKQLNNLDSNIISIGQTLLVK